MKEVLRFKVCAQILKGRKLVLTDPKTTGTQPILGRPELILRKGCIVVTFDCVRGC